jgi:5-deoxy-D-glucuronate isomerase
MNLKIALNPQQGYNKVFDVGEYGMKLTRFGLLKLAAGTAYEGDTEGTELALVLIGGNFAAKGEGWAFEVTDGRKSPFTGKPHCLYLPRNTKYTITTGHFNYTR